MDISQAKTIPAFHNDPYNPTLFHPETKVAELTVEQQRLIDDVLYVASSDTRFAQKASMAINHILTNGSTKVPEITSLNPNSKSVGSQSFKLSVSGKDFTPQHTIYANGNALQTTFGSEGELSADVSLENVTTVGQVPVVVRAENGALSNTVLFDVTVAAPSKKEVEKEKK